MTSVISIVGRSNSDEAVLLDKLIDEFSRRGYHLAIFKHCANGFDMDQPAKDSSQSAGAGGDTLGLSSGRKIALIKSIDNEAGLEELLHLIGGEFDLVLTEGLKGGNAHKIEVYQGESGELICSSEELLALVADEPSDSAVPRYSLNEVEALVDLIENRASAQSEVNETLLFINDTPIPLNPFVKDIIQKTLLGMVSALKGVDEVKSLRISLQRGLD